ARSFTPRGSVRMPVQAVRDLRLLLHPLPSRPWRPAPALAGVAAACLLALAGGDLAHAKQAAPAAASVPAPASISTPALIAPAPPTGVAAADVPNDGGKSLAVTWTASPDEKAHPERVVEYLLLRSSAA